MLAVALMLGACASRPPLEGPVTGGRVELSETPFYPQRDYQCGPAALATTLVASGAPVTPDELTPQVYLPARRGSLQPEMVAVTRRHERVPYVLVPEFAALLAELDAGHPVLVLQNLGLRWLPVWHYAVVIGYDGAAQTFTLRSGTTRRKVMPADAFARSWGLSGNWAMVTLPAERLPASAAPERFVAAVAGLEAIGKPALAERGYRAALVRWPDLGLAWFGLGNALYAQGDADGARQAFARAVQHSPGNVAAVNNLAQLQAEAGCPLEGLRTLAKVSDAALRAAGLEEAVAATRRELQALPNRRGACEALKASR